MHKCKRVMEEQEQQAEVNRVVSSDWQNLSVCLDFEISFSPCAPSPAAQHVL